MSIRMYKTSKSVSDIFCEETSVASFMGSSAKFTCDTRDIGDVTHFALNNLFATNVTEANTTQISETLTVSIEAGRFILTFLNVSCDHGGNYTVTLNKRSTIDLTLIVMCKYCCSCFSRILNMVCIYKKYCIRMI